MGVVSGTENRGFGDKEGLPYHIKLWVVKVKPSRKRELLYSATKVSTISRQQE